MAIPIEETFGDPYLRLLSSAYHNQQAATIRIVREYRGSLAIRHLIEDALARADRCVDAAMQISPPLQPMACGEGCYHCCWATVGVTAPDVIYMADELRGRLSEDELAALHHRSVRLSRRLNGMGRGERLAARLPCALLRDGGCSNYRHRPLVCRWASSPSLQSCLDVLKYRTKRVLEMEEVRYQPIQEVWRGMRAGLVDSGLDGSLLSLNGALSIALADPNVAQRYQDGEPVFRAARLE